MIDKLFFDTDCISAFLWVNEEEILFNLYPNKVILPKPVLDELKNPSIRHIGNKIDKHCKKGNINIKAIDLGTEEYQIYKELTICPPQGEKRIGKGEAAAIALAKTYDGIIASNNLKDVSKYVSQYNLKHITSSVILVRALENGYINEHMGNEIWSNMISKKRMLPASSFTEFLKTYEE